MVGVRATEEEIQTFVDITQSTPVEAEQFLNEGTTLEGAIEDYFAAQAAAEPHLDEDDEALADDIGEDERTIMSDDNNQSSNGPRTLDGRPAESLPAGWGSSGRSTPARSAAPRTGGIATLFNTGLHAGLSSGEPGRGGDDDDDSDEDGPPRDPQQFFNGGQASGLAVQNPNQPSGGRGLVDRILKQASDNGAARRSEETKTSSSTFGGAGNRLGTDEDPAPEQPPAGGAGSSSAGPGIAAASPSQMDSLVGSLFGGRAPEPEMEEEVQDRHLTFWRNGFSIEDGPLMAYDEHKDLLEAIHAGRAPPSLFGVRYNQPLQVIVAQRTNEDYRPPPKKPMKAFEGGGNRLGSSVPAPTTATGSGAASQAMPGTFGAAPAAASAASGTASSDFQVDESKPTTSIQLRLGDGTRLVAKVNLTHTVGDLRSYVRSARSDTRSFVLQTTFPSKELSDEAQTVEDAKLQNAVVVQRFTS